MARTKKPSQSIETHRKLLEEHGIQEPRNFDRWTSTSRLDYIGERILANARTTRSHNVMKAEGYLSRSQQERRKDREVYVSPGATLEDLALLRGQFSKPYYDSDRPVKNTDESY